MSLNLCKLELGKDNQREEDIAMTEIYTEFIRHTSQELAHLLLSNLPAEQLAQVQYKDQEAKAVTDDGRAGSDAMLSFRP